METFWRRIQGGGDVRREEVAPYTGTGAWYQDAVHLEDVLKPKLPRIPILY